MGEVMSLYFYNSESFIYDFIHIFTYLGLCVISCYYKWYLSISHFLYFWALFW